MSDPDQISTREAARILGKIPAEVILFAKAGVLSSTPKGAPQSQKRNYYFDRGEIEAFRDGGYEAARAYRESRGGKPRGRRKVKA